MGQKQSCIRACTIVGTIGGIIVAPAIGPLALAMPVLWNLFGRKMAEVEGLSDDAKKSKDKNLSLPYEVSSYGTGKSVTRDKEREIEFYRNALRILSSSEKKGLLGRRETGRVTKIGQVLSKKDNFNPGLAGARGTPDSED